MRKTLAFLALPLALCACRTVGPDYQAPSAATPASFAELGDGAVATSADLSRWWSQFGDPELNALVDRALAQSLDLQTAAARLREARSQITVARSALLPSVNGTAAALRRDAPFADSAPAGGGASPLAALPDRLTFYSLGADATWELDLFGGARRGVEAATAQAEAAEWQARDVQVALAGAVAKAYFNLRSAQARKQAAEADITRLQDLLDLVGARARNGLTTDIDVNQQRQALEARQASLPNLDLAARQSIHALGTLLALEPTALDVELRPPRDLPSGTGALPVGLPSDLLKRRPDIRAAERRYAAANAQIGVAMADLYPKLNLIGLASFASADLGDLLSKRNFGTIGLGQGTLPLFNGGRTGAQVEARQAQAQEAEIAYRSAILTALREVEDALSGYRAAVETERRLAQDLVTARDTEALVQRRYESGLSPFTDVLQAQAAITAAEDQAVTARSAKAAALATLFTALGGGWT